jgi:hypothetical protein
MKNLYIAAIACALLCARGAFAGELATDGKHGIELRVPDGYKVFPAGMTQTRALFAYARGEPGAPGFELIGVTGLGGTIGREAFDPMPMVQQIATAGGLTVINSSPRKLTWKGFELDGFVATMSQGDTRATVAAVQVPVKGEAVQIVVMRLGEEEVGKDLQTVLTGLEAESSWLTTDERVQKFVTGALTLLTTMGLVTYFVIRRRRERAAR